MDIDIDNTEGLDGPAFTSERHAPSSEEHLYNTAMQVLHPEAARLCCLHIEEMYRFWVALYQSKALITGPKPNWKENAIYVFRQIDSYIDEKHTTPNLQRIGYIGLAILMEDVKQVIGVNRRRGNIESGPGHRNASLALDLYLAAQDSKSNRILAKRQLNRRLEVSRRWLALSMSCPLLAVVYSEKAEKVIATRYKRDCLRNIAIILVKLSPGLGSAVSNLMLVAEKAAASGAACEQDIIQRIKGTVLTLVDIGRK